MSEGFDHGSPPSLVKIEAGPLHHDEELLRDAETIEQHLRFIRQAMRRFIEADKHRVSLTAPQLHALAVLTRPAHADGLTLKQLSEHMGLAHSTVSGIVDRLERQGLVRRLTNPTDRRSTRLDVTEQVKAYMQESFPRQRLGPLMTALQHASEIERKAVLEGLTTLRHLFMIGPDDD